MKYKLILNYTTSSGKQYRQACTNINDVYFDDENIDDSVDKILDFLKKGGHMTIRHGSETIWLNPDHVESVVIQKCVLI